MQRVLRSQADFRSTISRNQLTSLILFESITTRTGKAKSLVAFANRFFNRIKAGDLNAKKLAHQVLLDENAIKKVFEEILPRFDATETNFLRTLRVAPRRGDSAEQRLVMLTKTLQVSAKPAPKAKKTDKADA